MKRSLIKMLYKCYIHTIDIVSEFESNFTAPDYQSAEPPNALKPRNCYLNSRKNDLQSMK